MKYFRLFSLSRKHSTPFPQIAQAKAETLNNPFIPAYCRLIQRRGALPRPVSASRATRSDKRFRAPHAPDPKIPGDQRHALLCRTGATRPRFGQLAQPRQVRSGIAAAWQAHFFCAPSGPPPAAMDWQTGKAAGCRTLGKRRRPAEPAGCLSALWIPAPRSAVKTAAGMRRLPGNASSPSWPRRPGLPVPCRHAAPPANHL